MLRSWPVTGILSLLTALFLLILGCGGSPQPEPTPTPLSTSELRAMIQDAVTESMPVNSSSEGITEEQLRELIEQSIAESVQPGVTAEEVEQLVQAAVESSIVPGVTLKEVQEAIESALSAETSQMNPSGAAETEPLVVYSGRSESLLDAIIQQFSQATGIHVEVKYAGTPQLAATLLEEGENSPADIFFAQDPGGLGAIEGMLTTLPDRILSRVPEWARSTDGKWVGLSGRARTIVYNPERVSEEELPGDIWGFVDPEWKNRIGWAPTNASFQTMISSM